MFFFISKCIINISFLIIYNRTRLKEEQIFFIISLKYFKKSEILNFEIIQLEKFQVNYFKVRTLIVCNVIYHIIYHYIFTPINYVTLQQVLRKRCICLVTKKVVG